MNELEYQDVFEALMKRTQNLKFTTKVRSGYIRVLIIPILHFTRGQLEVLIAISKEYGLTFFITGNETEETDAGAMGVLK